jgi:hypothetical protein
MRKKETILSVEMDLCVGGLAKRFGQTFVRTNVKRYADEMLSLSCVEPKEGGNTAAFDMTTQEWVDSGQDFTRWTYCAGGTGDLSWLNPKPEWGSGFFYVRHPREFAELVALFRQPLTALRAPLPDLRTVRLSRVAELFALLPDGRYGWRAQDLVRLPKGLPRDMSRAIDRRLVQDYDTMTCGRTCAPPAFEENWPEAFGALPDATPLLREGYVLQKDRAAERALELAFEEGSNLWSTFAPVLVVPRGDDISAFFLREYLAGDRDAGAQLECAFSTEHNLAEVAEGLTSLPVTMPADVMYQIRLAAQANLMRREVLGAAFRLADCRAPFRELVVRHREAMRALDKMVAASQAC